MEQEKVRELGQSLVKQRIFVSLSLPHPIERELLESSAILFPAEDSLRLAAHLDCNGLQPHVLGKLWGAQGDS